MASIIYLSGYIGSGWDYVNETEFDLVKHNRKVSALKWFALALCLGIFIAYGILVG